MTAILSTQKSQPSGLHITTNHTGKMEGMQSLSTNVNDNRQCARNAKVEGSICSHCFAINQTRMYKSMNACLSRNGKILNAGIIDTALLPMTTSVYFRFQSFGDLAGPVEVINYFNLCRKNPQTKFALWTKNPKFIAQAISQGYPKPDNLQIVYSSLFVNRPNIPRYDFIDKVFTVYDKEAARKVDINCGARSCFMCHRCYVPNPEGMKVQMINEILK